MKKGKKKQERKKVKKRCGVVPNQTFESLLTGGTYQLTL